MIALKFGMLRVAAVLDDTSTATEEKAISTEFATLRRVAEALGVHVKQFFTEAPQPTRCASTVESLRLWSEITTEEGRRDALRALQAIVDRKQSGNHDGG